MLLGWALAVGLAASATDGRVRHETAVERLHRKGVHCMEVIERRKCAIKYFEDVLDERTTQRELVTDAMLRLIKLYQKDGDSDLIAPLLRKFWDIGMKRESRGHIPYSARFFPSELNVIVNIDVPRVVDAGVTKALGDNARDFVFTCDEARRNDIRNTWRWKRAERIAQREGRKTHEVLYEQMDKDYARKRKREAQRRADAKNGKKSRSSRRSYSKHTPIFVDAACKVAKALGQNDLLGNRRMTGAFNHHDFRQSMGAAEIPGLDVLIAQAVRAGRLRTKGTDHWVLAKARYNGGPVHLAKLDHEELVIAPHNMVDGVIEARRKRKRRMNRELVRLVNRVPKDTGFFVVLNQAAIKEMSLGQVKRGRGFLEALLPKPKGMQIAGVFHDYVGLFTRMPTDNQVKGRVLVSLARRVIDNRAEESDNAWLRKLDVAEAEDRRALLASYVLTVPQIKKMIYD